MLYQQNIESIMDDLSTLYEVRRKLSNIFVPRDLTTSLRHAIESRERTVNDISRELESKRHDRYIYWNLFQGGL